MACIDFFLMENMRFVVNEANTIPGFTDISMYLKAMAAPGASQARSTTFQRHRRFSTRNDDLTRAAVHNISS
ncbi:hypothetical protein GOA59_28120 [Sinorhizobium meliloti]|nr:hypothetical protein [Sinorhizobium meliloti]MDW9608784.1 hypothetical protein [Sinorhizobium meliloti]MDW9633920.1 hypothetical protein [Sinorhizobium meliloti]MDW9666335.1 hypothetical protein [Sinorhizobium meliloti]MDW9676583.1 hypothetical protein [Sinorhizobium meliloti]